MELPQFFPKMSFSGPPFLLPLESGEGRGVLRRRALLNIPHTPQNTRVSCTLRAFAVHARSVRTIRILTLAAAAACG